MCCLPVLVPQQMENDADMLAVSIMTSSLLQGICAKVCKGRMVALQWHFARWSSGGSQLGLHACPTSFSLRMRQDASRMWTFHTGNLNLLLAAASADAL